MRAKADLSHQACASFSRSGKKSTLPVATYAEATMIGSSVPIVSSRFALRCVMRPSKTNSSPVKLSSETKPSTLFSSRTKMPRCVTPLTTPSKCSPMCWLMYSAM